MARTLLPLTGYSVLPSTEVQASIVGLVEFIEIDLPTGTLYLTSANQPYTWGSHTYTPTTVSGMPYGAMNNYNEGLDGTPRPMVLTLSGCDATMLSNLSSSNVQWVNIAWSLGLLDSNYNLLNGTPCFTTNLYFGDCTISLGMNTGTITINAENLLADLQNRTSGCLQTVQDQQNRGVTGNSTFSKDTFYEYCASIVYTWVYWGMLPPGMMGTGGGSGAHSGGESTLFKQF